MRLPNYSASASPTHHLLAAGGRSRSSWLSKRSTERGTSNSRITVPGRTTRVLSSRESGERQHDPSADFHRALSSFKNSRNNTALSIQYRDVTMLPSRTTSLSTYFAPPCSASSLHLGTVVTVLPPMMPAAVRISIPWQTQAIGLPA